METTFLKRNRELNSAAAKWKHQAFPSLTGHMMIFIMDPWGERQVRESW